jgi:hypothetical protein
MCVNALFINRQPAIAIDISNARFYHEDTIRPFVSIPKLLKRTATVLKGIEHSIISGIAKLFRLVNHDFVVPCDKEPLTQAN